MPPSFLPPEVPQHPYSQDTQGHNHSGIGHHRQGNGHRFGQFLRHRISCSQRNSEVHVERVHHPIEILYRQWLVQTQHDAGLVDLLLSNDRRIALHIRRGRINGREPHQQEREKRDDKQSQQDDDDSPNEIPPGPLCHKTTSN